MNSMLLAVQQKKIAVVLIKKVVAIFWQKR